MWPDTSLWRETLATQPQPTPIVGKIRFQVLSMCSSLSQEKINPQQLLFYRKRFTDSSVPAKKKKYSQLDRQWQRWVVSNGVFRFWAGFKPRSSATWQHPGFQTLAGMPQSVTIRAASNFPVLTTRQDVFWRVFRTWVVGFQGRRALNQICFRKYQMLETESA